ncbi:MAG: DUF3239 domain-containing protein [Patescibacteria group bacterium]|nr:DUF3239 domain-containing protein [Patescibacteria group bacterium]
MYIASNPAQIRIDVVHFLLSDRKDLILLAGAVAIGGILAVYNPWAALVVLGIGVAMGVISIFQARTAFAEGDACPAIVVDPERNLIAVYTDLTKGGSPRPVVKVLKQPLGRVAGGPFQRRARLAFAALYNGFPQEPTWRNFGGYLANAGTRDEAVIERIVRRIPDYQWDVLEGAVASMATPVKPGLYELREP